MYSNCLTPTRGVVLLVRGSSMTSVADMLPSAFLYTSDDFIYSCLYMIFRLHPLQLSGSQSPYSTGTTAATVYRYNAYKAVELDYFVLVVLMC